MFKKSFYYNIIIKVRPDGSEPAFEQGVLDVPFYWNGQDAFQACVDYIAKNYEVNYGYHFQDFRRV